MSLKSTSLNASFLLSNSNFKILTISKSRSSEYMLVLNSSSIDIFFILAADINLKYSLLESTKPVLSSPFEYMDTSIPTSLPIAA